MAVLAARILVSLAAFSCAFSSRIGGTRARNVVHRRSSKSHRMLQALDDPGENATATDDIHDLMANGGKDLIVIGGCVIMVLTTLAIWQFCCDGEPFSPVCCLPASLQKWAPGSISKIQDVDHLALIFIAVLGTGLLIKDIVALSTKGCETAHTCASRFVDFVFLVPCTWYVFTCMGSYDERERNKKEELQKTAQSLDELKERSIEEMEALVNNLADSNVGLAERHFEGHKRDFAHFLEWYPKGLQLQDGIALRIGRKSFSPKEVEAHNEAADAIQHLTGLWLQIFRETSIVPTPLRGVAVPSLDDILEETAGPADAADQLAKRLRSEQVCYFAKEVETAERIYKRKKIADFAATFTPPWMLCCQRVGFGCSRGDDELRQWNCSFGFFRIYIRTKRHLILMLGVVAGIGLLVWHVLDGYADTMRKMASEAALFLYICGLIVVVMHFDKIDAVMILHMEIQKTKADSERLQATHERIMRAQREIQTIIDIWMVRTMPLLELTKEVCDRFRDACEEARFKDASALKIDLASTIGMNDGAKDLAIRVQALKQACNFLENQFERFGTFEDNLQNPRPKAITEALCANIRKRCQERTYACGDRNASGAQNSGEVGGLMALIDGA